MLLKNCGAGNGEIFFKFSGYEDESFSQILIRTFDHEDRRYFTNYDVKVIVANYDACEI